MSDMNVRSDAVDVEQIMQQIRARIREKRGADYTENELRQMATVKLEKFVDPKGLRSNLVGEFRRARVMPPPLTPERPSVDLHLELDADLDQDPHVNVQVDPAIDVEFDAGPVVDENTLYETHRRPLLLARRALRPIHKLLFNPDRLTTVLNKVTTGLHQLLHELKVAFNATRRTLSEVIIALQEQAEAIREHGDALRQSTTAIQKLKTGVEQVTQNQVNVVEVSSQLESRLRRFESQEPLSFELLHNLTTELTRLSIENHNLKMRVESLSSRLDFDERRAKALEGVVQYRRPAPVTGTAADEQPTDQSAAPAGAPGAPGGPGVPAVPGSGEAGGRRRRRRRRRRPGRTMADSQGRPWSNDPAQAGASGGFDEGDADAGSADGGADTGSDDGDDDGGPDTPGSEPDTTPQ